MPLRPTATAATTGVPPFHGYVDTTEDALCLIEAARRGILPRVTRRLNELERRSMIKSGAVFVFSVEESGIKRWTEGLTWSQSRIAGNFLIYRELADRVDTSADHEASSLSQAPQEIQSTEGSVMLKRHGLVKKTITVKIDGSDHHLISYYTQEDVRSGRLQRPSARPELRSIEIPAELLKSTSFRYPLKFESQRKPGLSRIDDGEDNQQGGIAVPGSPSDSASVRMTGEPAPRFSLISPAHFSHALPESPDTFYQAQSRKFQTTYPSLSLALPADIRQPSSPSPTDTAYSHLSVEGSPLQHSRPPSWSTTGHMPAQSFPDPAAMYDTSSGSASMQMDPVWSPERMWPNQQHSRLDRPYDQGIAETDVGASRATVSPWPPGPATFPDQSLTSGVPMPSLPSSHPGPVSRGCDQPRSRTSSSWGWMHNPAPSQYSQEPEAIAATFQTERQSSTADARVFSTRSSQIRPQGYPYRH